MDTEFFRTDVGLHFLDCLKFSGRQISLTYSDSREWPWTIIGLVGAIQASCALYLSERDTMEVATLSDPCRKKTIAALQQDSVQKIPKPYMASPQDLIDRVLKDSKRICISTESKPDLFRLVDFRREFMHFTPKSWSIHTAGLPRMAKAAFVLIEAILDDPGLYKRLSPSEREIAKKLCKSGIEQCIKIGINP